MPIMIWLAIIIELINTDWLDFVVLSLLQILNGTVGFIEEKNAGNAIAALKNSLRPACRVMRDGVWKTDNAQDLVPGDLIEVRLVVLSLLPCPHMCTANNTAKKERSSLAHPLPPRPSPPFLSPYSSRLATLCPLTPPCWTVSHCRWTSPP